MKKKLFLILAMVALLACMLVISVNAQEVDPNAEYYDKIYTDSNGREFPIYEKEGDTYHPLVWFAYEDQEVTKYVKARFSDIICYSLEPSQGRFNGCYYTHIDENGKEVELNSTNLVVLNLRAGVMAKTYNISKKQNGTDIIIKKIETNRTDIFPNFSRIEAIYIPLSQISVGSLGFSTLRVCDIDKNHGPLSFGGKAFQNSSLEEIFIPSGSTFSDNSHFQGCTKIKKIVFGAGFDADIPNYFFDRCSSLELVCFMGTKAQLESITVGTVNNGIYTKAQKISEAEYSALSEKSGTYVIYDCSPCTAFNNGVHTESDEITLVGNDFFSPIKITCVCAVDGCGARIETGEISPIVESKGYSASTFGKVLSVTQGFYVNKAALDTYRSYVPDIEIGLIAAVNGEKTEFTPNLESDKVIAAPIDTVIHSYIDIKVTGISEEQSETFIVFCMYITTGGKTYFLDGGKTGETVLGKSYADVLN